MKLIVLDNEAVNALSDVTSNKHRTALAFIEATRGPRRRRPTGARTVVPATVRLEAGWDRTDPASAVINRLGIEDHYLNRASTDTAARLRSTHGVTPADAHIGAMIQTSPSEDLTVLTSDHKDIAAVSEGIPVRIIHL